MGINLFHEIPSRKRTDFRDEIAVRAQTAWGENIVIVFAGEEGECYIYKDDDVENVRTYTYTDTDTDPKNGYSRTDTVIKNTFKDKSLWHRLHLRTGGAYLCIANQHKTA